MTTLAPIRFEGTTDDTFEYTGGKEQDWQIGGEQTIAEPTEGVRYWGGPPIAGLRLGGGSMVLEDRRYATVDLPENQDYLGVLPYRRVNPRNEADVTIQMSPWTPIPQFECRLYFVVRASSNVGRQISQDAIFDEGEDRRVVQGALTRVESVSPRMAERLRYLASLGCDWDGYGGSALTEEALGMCARMLEQVKAEFAFEKEPSILPLADGGLQLDWYYSRVDDLTIVIPPEGDVAEYLAVYDGGERLVEGTLTVGTLSSTLLGL